MKLKINIPELKKYVPETLSVYTLVNNIGITLDSALQYHAMSPEERERILYESLKKKYEED